MVLSKLEGIVKKGVRTLFNVGLGLTFLVQAVAADPGCKEPGRDWTLNADTKQIFLNSFPSTSDFGEKYIDATWVYDSKGNRLAIFENGRCVAGTAPMDDDTPQVVYFEATMDQAFKNGLQACEQGRQSSKSLQALEAASEPTPSIPMRPPRPKHVIPKKMSREEIVDIVQKNLAILEINNYNFNFDIDVTNNYNTYQTVNVYVVNTPMNQQVQGTLDYVTGLVWHIKGGLPLDNYTTEIFYPIFRPIDNRTTVSQAEYEMGEDNNGDPAYQYRQSAVFYFPECNKGVYVKDGKVAFVLDVPGDKAGKFEANMSHFLGSRCQLKNPIGRNDVDLLRLEGMVCEDVKMGVEIMAYVDKQ
ncbi:MAG: hypothetical protein KKG59_02995 [Nanoarchaeota archaeon]|nr:hypothetical protein [Nanoarchaeota archaeon]